MSDTTHSYTQSYCCQWHECSGLRIFFLWYTIRFHIWVNWRTENWRLWSLSLSVCVIPPSVPKEEKKSHYKINFYSPCDKCYAYVGVQCSFCYGKMVSPFWWTHCDDSYTVSQIHFKQKTWILLNLQIEIFIRVPAGFHLNFVNCSNKHVYQTIWPWLGKLMLYVNFSNIKIANFTRWWSICGSIFQMLFFFCKAWAN